MFMEMADEALASGPSAAGASSSAAPSASSAAPSGEPPPSYPWERFVGAAVISDDEGHDDDGDDGAAPEGAAIRDQKRLKRSAAASCGTAEARWAARCSKACIMEDLRIGCSCGCLEKVTFDEVRGARESRREEGASGRREFVRGYLEFNPAPDG